MRLSVIAIICFFYSCEATNNQTSANIENTVETVIVDKSQISVINELIEEQSEFPVYLDSNLFKVFNDSQPSLPVSFIEQALNTFNGGEYEDYYLKQYLFIDSLKVNGVYDSYPWDIGMIMYTNSFAIDTLTTLDSFDIILWGLKESTYEACPYGDYSIIYGTVFNKKDSALGTFSLAEKSYGGDPPAFGSTTNYAVLDKDLTLTQELVQINGEDLEDEMISDTTRETSVIQLYDTLTIKNR